MAFNANTFDLTGRWPLVEVWMKAFSFLNEDPSQIFYVPAEDEGQAKSLMHTFNRVRRALIAQKEDSDSLTHIILKVGYAEVGGREQWVISFSDRSEPLQAIKLVDKEGNIL